MNKLEQAARQALEALEVSTDWDVGAKGKQLQSMKAITALREALAEPDIEEMTLTQIAARHEQAEQELVAWGRVFDGDIIDCICPEEHALNEGVYTIPLYSHPVRTKDLTDDEIATVYEQDKHHHGEFNYRFDPVSFARAVIAADREKNKCQH